MDKDAIYSPNRWPDDWEFANGLNKNDAADRNNIHSSGYTMLEVYLNSL